MGKPPIFNEDWINEYAIGCGYEIYRVKLSDGFDGISFGNAASIVWEELHVIMFALEIHNDIFLHPNEYIMENYKKNDCYVFVFAEDSSQAEIIKKISSHLKEKVILKKIHSFSSKFTNFTGNNNATPKVHGYAQNQLNSTPQTPTSPLFSSNDLVGVSI